MRFFFILPLFVFLLFPQTSVFSSNEGYVDTHMHLSPSGKRAGGNDFEAAAKRLVELMDQTGVERAIVMPPPKSPEQRRGQFYKDILPALKKHPGRLYPAGGGGELNPMIHATYASAVTPAIRAEFRRRAERIALEGAKAFGEMTALHYSFSPTHSFEQAPADHPLFLELADIGAKYGMAIDLHMEAVPERQRTPQALLNRSPRNPEWTHATLPGLERLLEHNRASRVVWTHVGWDNTGHLTPALLRSLLAKHLNLYCAIKFVREKYEPFGKGNKLLDEETGQINEDWLSLLKDYPDRFMVGADDFISEGERKVGAPSFEDTWSLIKRLPEDLRTKIGRKNALHIYRLEG